MVIVMVRRCVKRDKVDAFLENYHLDKPKHPDFICEHLTRLSDDSQLSEAMSNLKGINCDEDAIVFVNVAFWKTARSFEEYFEPRIGKYDQRTETCDRARAVLEVSESIGVV